MCEATFCITLPRKTNKIKRIFPINIAKHKKINNKSNQNIKPHLKVYRMSIIQGFFFFLKGHNLRSALKEIGIWNMGNMVGI